MTAGTPSWLAAAVAERASGDLPASEAIRGTDVPPAVGQVRVLQHMDLRASADRVGLVVAVDEDLAVAHVLLASPLVEYRTAVDYLLEPSATCASMPLIVECDLRGAVWFTQLGSCLGMSDSRHAVQLDHVGAGALPQAVGLEQSRFGLPARDSRDPRWAWKVAELDALNVLTHECDEWLLAGERCPGIIDPAFMESLADPAARTPEVTEALFSLGEAFDARLAGDSLESLAELLEDADPDTQAALMPLLENTLAGLGASPAVQATWQGHRLQDTRRERELAIAVAQGAAPAERCVVVITSREAWGSSRRASVLTPATVDVAGEARVQVRPIGVDSLRDEVAT